MTSENFTKLDALDLKLIKELEVDARKSYKDIAKDLDIARSTVTFRIQRLLHNNIISMTCWVDPLAMGYKLLVMFGISTQQDKLHDIANKLAACPSVLGISLSTGRFDMIMMAVFRDNDELDKFSLNVLGSTPGILQTDRIIILREVKASYGLSGKEQELHPLRKGVKELDRMDILLIRELQINPKMRPGSLARKFGVYESNIRRRIQRLMDQKIISCRAYIDPGVLGYEIFAQIGFKCNPDQTRKIAEAVSSFNNIVYVGICAGRYDISAYGVFKKLHDLEDFINFELGVIPGLVYTETAVLYKNVKRKFQVPA